jgi:hypothetical protein
MFKEIAYHIVLPLGEGLKRNLGKYPARNFINFNMFTILLG